MLKLGRRLGISSETVEAVNVSRIAKKLHCLPSQVRAERADDIEVFIKIEAIEAELEKQNNNL